METVTLLTQNYVDQMFKRLLDEIGDLKTELKTVQTNKDEVYYRNEDLKRIFKISENTIIKYRESNFIPYTTFGKIFVYPISQVNKILKNNANYIM